MYQVVVGGMENCPKESFELAGIPVHQDEVGDHAHNDILGQKNLIPKNPGFSGENTGFPCGNC
jgi:hypothetical protein